MTNKGSSQSGKIILFIIQFQNVINFTIFTILQLQLPCIIQQLKALCKSCVVKQILFNVLTKLLKKGFLLSSELKGYLPFSVNRLLEISIIWLIVGPGLVHSNIFYTLSIAPFIYLKCLDCNKIEISKNIFASFNENHNCTAQKNEGVKVSLVLPRHHHFVKVLKLGNMKLKSNKH